VPSTLSLFLSLCRPLVDASSSLPSLYLPLFSREHLSALSRILDDLELCVQFGHAINRFRWEPSLFVEFLEDWMERVRDLRVGDRLIVNGGWIVSYGSGKPGVYLFEEGFVSF
jgi:hypothetical protein